MAYPSSPAMLHLSAGVLIGFGLAGCSFPMVIGALGKLVPENWRAFAFGAGTAAGSFGQFLFSPLARALIDAFNWQTALLVFAALMLLVLPLSLVLATPRRPAAAPRPRGRNRYKQALSEAFGIAATCCSSSASSPAASSSLSSPSTCRPIWSTAASPPTWAHGRSASSGCSTSSARSSSGWLASRMPKRYILSAIYFARALSIVAFIYLPATPASTLIFGAVTGLLWLSTVPPTSGLVAVMFGTRWLAMLFGFAFFSHQVGGFLGVLARGVGVRADRLLRASYGGSRSSSASRRP